MLLCIHEFAIYEKDKVIIQQGTSFEKKSRKICWRVSLAVDNNKNYYQPIYNNIFILFFRTQ